jgi:uncharacterized FAD-dependent dehydrogenase
MIRLSDLALPLDHSPADLDAAIAARLGIVPARLLRHHLIRRGHDARRKAAIRLVYALDVEVEDEAEVLARLAGDAHVRPRPT